MPRHLPPIAPRAPNSPERPADVPVRVEHFDNLEVQPGEDGYIAQLAALAADKRRFLTAHHPIKDALHMALQQPAGALLARMAKTGEGFRAAIQRGAPEPSDEPGETQAGTLEDLDTRPAIVAFTETMVAKAILGDLTAASLVADRVEGKPGLRKADVDAETAAQRERVRSVVGMLVEDMVERRERDRGHGTTVIDGEATVEE